MKWKYKKYFVADIGLSLNNYTFDKNKIDMEKIDYKKELKSLYKPKTKPEFIEVPQLQFLTINGKGEVGAIGFQNAIKALFSASYKIKFACKNHLNIDYAVMPLEGLWWAENMDDFINGNKNNWNWQLMIMQPDFISSQLVNDAITNIKTKKDIKLIDDLKFELFHEGKSFQVMHVGPFSEEHENIMKIHDNINKMGGSFDGKIQKHHEIYLNDFRKVNPLRMKTILRQAFI